MIGRAQTIINQRQFLLLALQLSFLFCGQIPVLDLTCWVQRLLFSPFVALFSTLYGSVMWL